MRKISFIRSFSLSLFHASHNMRDLKFHFHSCRHDILVFPLHIFISVYHRKRKWNLICHKSKELESCKCVCKYMWPFLLLLEASLLSSHKSRAFDRLNKEDEFLIHFVFVLEVKWSVIYLNEYFIQDIIKGFKTLTLM